MNKRRLDDTGSSEEILNLESATGRSRRQWTNQQKGMIVRECSELGNTVSSVAKRYSISTSVLFQWRKQIENASLEICSRTDLSKVDYCRRDLAEIEKLQRLQEMAMGRLIDEIRRGQVTSYNASIATSNIVSGFAKLASLRAEVLDKLEALLTCDESKEPEDDVPIEIQRAAEQMVIELVKKQIAEEQAAKCESA